jgi:hypothetical protein
MKKQRLSDAYRFPGFIPEHEIQVNEADAGARVIRMKRRQKKRFVLFADWCIKHTTTVLNDESATCPAVKYGYFLKSKYVVSIARGATW